MLRPALTFGQPAEPPLVQSEGGVVAYHPLAREIGEDVLAAGGNAADAFVAAAIAQNVLAEGISSLAGPMGVLVYWKAHQKPGAPVVVYLDADFNTPHDPAHRYVRGSRYHGTGMLVPGAPLGLWELAAKYGTRTFAALAAPSIDLAEKGFPVTRAMAMSISMRKKVLRSTDYGKRTFFKDRKPLEAGDRLHQPEVATFLRRLSEDGPDYVYRGEWGERFLEIVRSKRGTLTEKDLDDYDVQWCPAWNATYRGHDVHAMSGSSMGGLWALLALKVWEHIGAPPGVRAWENADVLEMMIRTAHHCWAEPYLLNADALADEAFIRWRLSDEQAAEIRERVCRAERPRYGPPPDGKHSYPLITHDRDGNIVSGTITIASDAWGDGYFVDGIPLSHAGRVAWATRPGQRRISILTGQIVFREGRPRFAVDTISNSLAEAAFQILVNLIDGGMSLEETVTAPRFGTFPITGRWTGKPIKMDRNWLDPRVPKAVVSELKRRGLKVVQRGVIDTGIGAILAAEPKEAITVPIPYLARPYDT